MTTVPALEERVRHEEAIVNGVRLHYVEAGPEDGDLVVLLHGFPEYWATWRHQIPALADAGFRVVAPDLRGYNRSEKPHGLEAYRLSTLTGDVAALVSHLQGGEGDVEVDSATAHVVGHDWGGMIAWATAAEQSVVDRLVVLNAPHPAKYARELTLEQARRSWYAVLFQLPWVPEALLSARGYRAIETLFRDGPMRPDAFTEADVERFTRAIARPGALTSALAYYRALAREEVREHLPANLPVVGDRLVDPVEAIDAPTLVCWGERDAALALEQLDGLERYVDDLRIERFPTASHWVHVEYPARVSDAIAGFLAADDRRS